MTKTVYVGGTPITTEKQMRARAEHDFYETSACTIEAYLKHKNLNLDAAIIIDPGAGKGIFGNVIRSMYEGSHIIGIEKYVPEDADYSNYSYVFNNDYLNVNGICADPHYYQDHYVIGNPPYKLAEEFFWHSYNLIKTQANASIIFLLRLGFLESQCRYETMWSKGYKPYEVTVLNTRPSFTGDGKSYPAAFAFIHWKFRYGSAIEASTVDFLIYARS